MSEEIKDIMDALENNELKNDGFWGRACSRLSQQLQACKEELQAYKEDRFCQGGCTVYQFDKIKLLKEENERLKSQNKLFKGTIKKFNLDWYGEELDTLTQQNKQMREALENVKFEAEFNGNDESLQKIINIVDNALKGGE